MKKHSDKRILINIIAYNGFGGRSVLSNILNTLLLSDHRDREYFIYVNYEVKKKLGELPKNFHVYAAKNIEKKFFLRLIFEQLFLPLVFYFKRMDVFMNANFAILLFPIKQAIRISQPVCFSRDCLEELKKLGGKFKYKSWILRKLILLSVKRARRSVFLSHSLVDDVMRYRKKPIPKEKCVVSYNGIDPVYFSSRKEIEKDIKLKLWGANSPKTFYVIYPSAYRFYKNFNTLLRALNLIKKTANKECKLVLTTQINESLDADPAAGGWRISKQIIEEFGLAGNIVFLDSIEYMQMHHLYKMCDLVAFPSLAEACPNPLLEAMSCETPLVVSDIAVHRELCQDAALYFERFSPDDLADKIIKLMNDKDLRNHLSNIGKKRADFFSWEKNLKDLWLL